MHVVIVFEPAFPGEGLTAEQQVHQVVGPFPDGDVADAWITERQRRHHISAEFAIAPSHFTYLITDITTPEEDNERWQKSH